MARTSMQRLVLLLTAGLATVLVALALASTSASAEGTGFCGGQRVSNIQSCIGSPRIVYGLIVARGDSTGVCVGYNEIIYGGCSPNGLALELAAMNISGYIQPRVIGMSRSLTVAWGTSY
jgi:hypothetical protein